MTVLLERLSEKVLVGDGCWPWLGAKVPKGYGQFWDGTRVKVAHRIIYELVRGPIPDGFELDHLCRNRGCVNPSHLEAVTRTENQRRGWRARGLKTHCKRGHEFTETNTYRHSGLRHCRTCKLERQRTYRAAGAK